MGQHKKNIRDRVIHNSYHDSHVNNFQLLIACLKYMSCDDIKDMLRANDIQLEDENEKPT